MVAVQAGADFKVGSTRVAVVEPGADEIVIRMQGRNVRYGIADMPAGLALAMAQAWFDETPANKVLLGAFLLADPNGNNEDARELWTKAQQQGVPMDDLLPLLDQFTVVVEPVRGELPLNSAILAAQKRLQQRYLTRIKEATTPDALETLARRFYSQAIKKEQPSAERYCLFMAAWKVSVQAQQLGRAFEIIEKMNEWFEMDVFETKKEALFTASQAAEDETAYSKVALAAIETSRELMDAGDQRAAGRIIRIAESAAAKSGDARLMKKAEELAQLLD